MKQRKRDDTTGSPLVDEEPADERETRAYLLERGKRDAAPILKAFVQNGDRTIANRAGPLSVFVRHGDLRALRAFLFLHAFISSGDDGWSATLPLMVWARVFDTTRSAEDRSASTAATKVLARLVERRLVERRRAGRARNVTVTLLRPDGTGSGYTRPGRENADRFLKLSNAFWTDGWYETLDLPATAMLLVALHEKPAFELATERVPEWYGFSADTAERGMTTLRDLGLISVRKRTRKAPLSPTGSALVNVYNLTGPFARSEPAEVGRDADRSADRSRTKTPKKPARAPVSAT